MSWTNSAALNKTLDPSGMQLLPPFKMAMVTIGPTHLKSSSGVKYDNGCENARGDIKIQRALLLVSTEMDAEKCAGSLMNSRESIPAVDDLVK